METMLWRVENSRRDTAPIINTASTSSFYSPCDSRPRTPSRSRPLSCGRPCTAPERCTAVASSAMSRPSTPTASSRPSTATAPSRPTTPTTPSWPSAMKCTTQGFDALTQDQTFRQSMVVRTRNMVAATRSLSAPIETSIAAKDRSCALRDSQTNTSVHDRNMRRPATYPFVKDGSLSFNLAMERCKAFGGHRLRAVRKDFGAGSMSLVDQIDYFRHRGC